MIPFPPIDPFHPLTQAARDVNDHFRHEPDRLERTIAWLEMGELGELSYLAQQRALRVAGATWFGYEFGSEPMQDEAMARRVVAREDWPEFNIAITSCYLDGMAIGWRGRMLFDRHDGGGS